MIVAMLILAALQALVDLVHHHSNGFKRCTAQVHWKKQEKKWGKVRLNRVRQTLVMEEKLHTSKNGQFIYNKHQICHSN